MPELDFTSIATYTSDVGDQILAVGVVIIGLAAVSLGIRWVKAMFF